MTLTDCCSFIAQRREETLTELIKKKNSEMPSRKPGRFSDKLGVSGCLVAPEICTVTRGLTFPFAFGTVPIEGRYSPLEGPELPRQAHSPSTTVQGRRGCAFLSPVS